MYAVTAIVGTGTVTVSTARTAVILQAINPSCIKLRHLSAPPCFFGFVEFYEPTCSYADYDDQKQQMYVRPTSRAVLTGSPYRS